MSPQESSSAAELIHLCYSILDTASPANVTKDIGSGKMNYHIIDTSDNTPILSALRLTSIFIHPRLHEYSIELYGQHLPLSPLDAESLYHNMSAACSAILNEKSRAEEQKRKAEAAKQLHEKILKAQDYLKNSTSNLQH